MLERCFLTAALLLGCAPAALPVATPLASRPVSAELERPVPRSEPHKARRLARLAPPFGAAGGTRRVPDGDAPTALVAAP